VSSDPDGKDRLTTGRKRDVCKGGRGHDFVFFVFFRGSRGVTRGSERGT